jgi:hypothetical protein
VPTVLADAHTNRFVCHLLVFRFEYLHYKGGNRQKKPFNDNPPPTNEYPPNDAVVLID